MTTKKDGELMRIYKPTWKKNGETKTSPRYHVVFRDHTNTRRRLAAFADKTLSEELGRKAERLSGMCRRRPATDA